MGPKKKKEGGGGIEAPQAVKPCLLKKSVFAFCALKFNQNTKLKSK